ncbi:hypothetical protein L1887_06332 [Cichorium endivia]|nr:hypothetical protein L1887_06332 [Cichorium endivia]
MATRKLSLFSEDISKNDLHGENLKENVLVSSFSEISGTTQVAKVDHVKQAENLMLERGENKEYLPVEALAAFNKATAELLFGADNPVFHEQRVATIQGLSGTGSLKIAAALIERYILYHHQLGVTTRIFSMMREFHGLSTDTMIQKQSA